MDVNSSVIHIEKSWGPYLAGDVIYNGVVIREVDTLDKDTATKEALLRLNTLIAPQL